MATVLDKHHKQAVLIEITGTAPNAWTLFLCPKGQVVSGYVARMTRWPDLVKDDQGSVRTSFTVEQHAPITVTDAGVTKTYASLAKMLQVYEPRNASVTIKIKGATDAGDTETVTAAVGRIVQLSHFGPQSGTFQVELRSDVIETTIPQRIVKRQAGWVDDQIPEAMVGEAVPVVFGRSRPADGLFASQSTDAIRSAISYIGMPPHVWPSTEVQRAGTSRMAWAEKVSGGLNVANVATSSNGAPWGFIWDGRAGAYCPIYNAGSNIVFDAYNAPYNSMAWTGQTAAAVYAQCPVVPVKISSSTGVTNPQAAIDRKPWTYATIASGGELILEIPQVNLGWRITSNSTIDASGSYDYEGTGVPPGLAVYVLWGEPAAGPGRASGTFRTAVVFPKTTDELFGDHLDTSHTGTSGDMGTARHMVVYTKTGSFGSSADGWGGTKFHHYNFSCAPANSGQDAPLWKTGTNDKRDEPFRIRITHLTGGNVFVFGVAWVIGFQYGVEAYQPTAMRTKHGQSPANYAGPTSFWGISGGQPVFLSSLFGKKKGKKTLGYYGGRGESSGDLASGERHAWGREALLQPRKKQGLSGVYVSAAGYTDDGSGTYTGTATKLLNNPAAVCHYLLKQYGGQTSFETTLDAFGSFRNARDLLDTWATYNSGTLWEDNITIGEEMSVESAVRMIAAETPGLQILKKSDGKWCAHVWTHDTTKFANDLYSATALDVRQVVLADPQGLALQIETGDIAEAINEIEVAYGWDPARQQFLYRAMCDNTTYDDGQGGNWPVAPGTGADAVTIAAWSRTRFGKKKREIQAHGLRDPKLAALLGAYHLWRFYRPPVRLEMTAKSALYGMEVGHIFRLSNASMTAFGFEQPWWGVSSTWDSVYWECTHIEAQWNDGALAYSIEAAWRPTSIGGEVAGFAPGEEGGAM